MQKILCAKGIKCSVAKVSRAMKTLGIRCIVAEKFIHRKSSMSEEEKKKIVNLIKNLKITGINQVWSTDITYIKTIDEGNYYLISYIDLFSRKIVAWSLEPIKLRFTDNLGFMGKLEIMAYLCDYLSKINCIYS